MGGLVQLGNVPEWVQAATGAVNLYTALRNRWQKQALDWAAMFEELAGLDREELRRIVEENPAIAELVGIAWEAGAETRSVDKRRLLAKVAASALRGDSTPDQVEPLQFLLRTVAALDPPHVTLLVVIGQLDREKAEGKQSEQLSRADVEARWPSSPDLMDAALATLEREALIQSMLDYDGRRRQWRLRPYGRRFIDHLLLDEGGWPLDKAQ
jgi:hypothetical protein